MKFVEHFDRVKKMNRLIKSGSTGTPDEFARKIGICTSHLYRYLFEMQQFGMEIGYSRSMRTYYYKNDDELEINYSIRVTSEKFEKEKFRG